MRSPRVLLVSLAVIGLAVSGVATAGVTGNMYSGDIDFGPLPGTGPSCISFDANGDFTFVNNSGLFTGTSNEVDLLLFSFWDGTSNAGSAYSGFSLLTFLNIYSITTTAGDVGASLSFIGGACPTSASLGPESLEVDETGKALSDSDD